MLKSFEEFINEDFVYDTDSIIDYVFGDRWFYYESDDEIIYGCDNMPVDVKSLFYFNPKTCSVFIEGKKIEYDLNNPICLIKYIYKDNEVQIYKEEDEIKKYFESLDYNITGDILSDQNKSDIQNLFMKDDNSKSLLIYGDKLIASTFDIIDEK